MTIEQYPSSNNIASTVIWKYTGQGTELVLSGTDSYGQVLNFTPGSEQLFLNGVLLVRTQDYTPAANGLSITLPSSLAYGDFVQIYCYSNYSISTIASSAITGAVQNTQLANSGITIGNQTIGLGQSITIPTGLTLSGSTNTFSNIPNSGLTNSSIIINGQAISLGASVNITTPNNILPNKGGLIVGTGGGSVTQLTVGSDGTSPISDSSQTTNISWAGPTTVMGKNYVFNGNFESWQVSTNPSTPTYCFAGQYTTADRWNPQYYQNGKYSRVSVTAGSGPSSRYAMRSQSSTTTENSGGTRMSLGTRLDSTIAQNLRGKPLVLSFWMRFSAATISSVSNSSNSSYDSMNAYLAFNTTTTDSNSGTTGWDAWNNIAITNGSLPTTWTKYAVSLTAPLTTNNILVLFQFGALGNTAVDGSAWYEITDVQLEVGNVATSFAPAGGTRQGDIMLSGSQNFDGVFVGTGSSTYPSGAGQSGWAGYQVAGKNAIINGAMDFWARGTSFSTSQGSFQYAFGADRWQFYRGGGGSTTQLNRIASDLTGFQYHARVQRTSGDAGTTYVGFWQTIETAESLRFAGKPVTLSFYARAGAGFSGTYVTSSVYTGTGTDQAWYSFTNAAAPITQQNTLTANWQRFTVTGVIPANVTELGVTFIYNPTGTASSTDYYEITGVQLEQGAAASSFSRHGGTMTQELAACQRFCFQDTMEKHLCSVRDTGLIFFSKDFPITMRTAPTYFTHNLTTKVTGGSFPATAGQIGFYGNGWITPSATALSCLSDGQSPTTGAVYITGFTVSLNQTVSLQSNGLSYFRWEAEIY